MIGLRHMEQTKEEIILGIAANVAVPSGPTIEKRLRFDAVEGKDGDAKASQLTALAATQLADPNGTFSVEITWEKEPKPHYQVTITNLTYTPLVTPWIVDDKSPIPRSNPEWEFIPAKTTKDEDAGPHQ